MTEKSIELRGKKYPAPSMNRMKRKAVKKLKPLLERLKNEDLEALWEIVGAMMPTLTVAVLDDLDLGECKSILTDAGVAKFDSETPDAEITAGESSASTSS